MTVTIRMAENLFKFVTFFSFSCGKLPFRLFLTVYCFVWRKVMNSQSVFTKSFKTGVFLQPALFFVIGTVHAADTETATNKDGEPCQLTPVEKYLERHPESQWPPSRREEIRRCDNALDQQKGVNPSAQENENAKEITKSENTAFIRLIHKTGFDQLSCKSGFYICIR